ncbi:MAG: cob(I)yrinic acid a,c-diamide adenosyltransferase [Candidatus Micrarchaeota archaeon]
MPAYTRTGDDGTTALFGGRRVLKSSIRMRAIGDVDELSACIGLARSLAGKTGHDAVLPRIQELLFVAGADLATPMDFPSKIKRIGLEETKWLEQQADAADKPLKPLKNFILPGGSAQASVLHYARTVCRRAERCVAALAEKEVCNTKLLPFLNRLSSLIFVLARQANAEDGVKEDEWKP